jgi:hypothetical protein
LRPDCIFDFLDICPALVRYPEFGAEETVKHDGHASTDIFLGVLIGYHEQVSVGITYKEVAPHLGDTVDGLKDGVERMVLIDMRIGQVSDSHLYVPWKDVVVADNSVNTVIGYVRKIHHLLQNTSISSKTREGKNQNKSRLHWKKTFQLGKNSTIDTQL